MYLSSEILSLISQNLKSSCDSEHIPFERNISRMHTYSSVSISTRNLKRQASPITKIGLRQKFKKTGHVALSTPHLGVVWHHRLEVDTVYQHAKFDDSSFSHSRDVIRGVINLLGHMTLTTPLLRVICHPYPGTWHRLHACKIWPL